MLTAHSLHRPRRSRFVLFRPGVARVGRDGAGPAAVRRSFLLTPTADFGYRLVIDLEPVSSERFSRLILTPEPAEETPATSASEPTPEPRPKPGKTGMPLIVFAAGHGGVDPGTTGLSGG